MQRDRVAEAKAVYDEAAARYKTDYSVRAAGQARTRSQRALDLRHAMEDARAAWLAARLDAVEEEEEEAPVVFGLRACFKCGALSRPGGVVHMDPAHPGEHLCDMCVNSKKATR